MAEMKRATEAIRVLVKAAQRLCVVNQKMPGSVLSKAARVELMSLMDKVTGSDVGLLASSAAKLSNITYMHIYDEPTFSMGVFILPPNAAIPLHDHPGMDVISKVLNGSLHILSCDWEDPAPLMSGGGLAHVDADETVRAPSMCSLGPKSNNVHSFRGGDVTGCAILDILTPPYDFERGRPCNYFRVDESIPLRPKGECAEIVGAGEEAASAVKDRSNPIMLVPFSPHFTIDSMAFPANA